MHDIFEKSPAMDLPKLEVPQTYGELQELLKQIVNTPWSQVRFELEHLVLCDLRTIEQELLPMATAPGNAHESILSDHMDKVLKLIEIMTGKKPETTGKTIITSARTASQMAFHGCGV